MSASLVQATFNALAKTSLVLDDIPALAFNLIDTKLKKSHPAAEPVDLPTPRKGKAMSEIEFYLKAAAASFGPKFLISLGLGTLAAGLSFIGLPGILTAALVPLSLWVSGKSAEHEEDAPGKEPAEYKLSLSDKALRLFPGVKKFMDRLPLRHRRILNETIKTDVALEMEIMTVTAVSVGASGIATAGILGLAASIALVPLVAFVSTAIVWSASLGLRKFRNSIAKRQREIAEGLRPKKFFDPALKIIDKNIEPAFSIVGRIALMAMAGGLVAEHALIPLAQFALPHLAAALAPAVAGALHAFEAMPGLARFALQVPLGYGVGKYVYQPLIAPALSAARHAAGKIFSRFKKQKVSPPPSAPAPAAPMPAMAAPAGKIQQLKALSPAFKAQLSLPQKPQPALGAPKAIMAFAVK